jgi:hypothetical protein
MAEPQPEPESDGPWTKSDLKKDMTVEMAKDYDPAQVRPYVPIYAAPLPVGMYIDAS